MRVRPEKEKKKKMERGHWCFPPDRSHVLQYSMHKVGDTWHLVEKPELEIMNAHIKFVLHQLLFMQLKLDLIQSAAPPNS